MLPQFPEFRRLGLDDAPLVGKFYSRSLLNQCEFSFANLLVWRDFDRPDITFINGNLCLKINPVDEAPFFLEPMGGNDLPDTARICLSHTGRMSRLSPAFISKIPDLKPHAKPLRNHFDYIYRTKDLVEIKGEKFDGKRNHVKHMKMRFPSYEYVELKKVHAGIAIALFDDWSSHRKKVDSKQQSVAPELEYTCQLDALKRAFEYYDELRLIGGQIRVEDVCAGFVVGSKLRDDMACVHFLYSRPDFPGSFQTVLWEACRNSFSEFEFVNLEQDLGLPGLRRIKNSYHPIRLEEKFEIATSS